MLGVSIDEKGLKKVQQFVAARKITYPIGLDSDEDPTWARFRVKAIPAAFLVDRNGQIVAQWTGRPADMREIESKLTTLLKLD